MVSRTSPGGSGGPLLEDTDEDEEATKKGEPKRPMMMAWILGMRFSGHMVTMVKNIERSLVGISISRAWTGLDPMRHSGTGLRYPWSLGVGFHYIRLEYSTGLYPNYLISSLIYSSTLGN